MNKIILFSGHTRINPRLRRELKEIQTETYAEVAIIDDLIEMTREIEELKRRIEKLE